MGRQCGKDRRRLWEAHEFEDLEDWDISIVVEEWNLDFNCFAWAAGDTENKWWPETAYWPNDDQEATQETFVRAYGSMGYVVCQDDSLEPGFDKIALYLDEDGKPQHAARQLDALCWSSKLGDCEILCHPLEAIEGKKYGEARVFLKRPVDPERPDPVRALGCPGAIE